ncbi:MAG: hypothetical protein JOZ51_27750 [Chloroflexi bacterium]|nr:hypothetical protein [Chloroflexota bacterium]
MYTWEYLVAQVDEPEHYLLEGHLEPHAPEDATWPMFLANRLRDGWQIVPAESALQSGCSEEVVLKRQTTQPVVAHVSSEALNTSTLIVRLELSTSCMGAYWTPVSANGRDMYRSGVMDNGEYYNRLGSQGWELIHVRNLSGEGAYEPEYAPREATLHR